MGRHTVPGTGRAEPDRGFWSRVAVAVVLLALVGGWFVVRAVRDDGVSTTNPNAGGTTASPASTSTSGTGAAVSATQSPGTSPGVTTGAASSSATAGTATSPTTGSTPRPVTLTFTVKRAAYITISVPGGRTLVSRTFAAGATGSFDQRVLRVVNGRPDAVRFIVNGTPRTPGPASRPETFTVRRR